MRLERLAKINSIKAVTSVMGLLALMGGSLLLARATGPEVVQLQEAKLQQAQEEMIRDQQRVIDDARWDIQRTVEAESTWQAMGE